jgi:hypothetical protein
MPVYPDALRMRRNAGAKGGRHFNVPVKLRSLMASASLLLASSLDQAIAPNATFVMEATGPAPVPYQEGSAQLAATRTVDGFEIFHYDPTNQEAVVPLETRNAPSYLLAFDNTNNVLNGRGDRERLLPGREHSRDHSQRCRRADRHRNDRVERQRPHIVRAVNAVSGDREHSRHH